MNYNDPSLQAKLDELAVKADTGGGRPLSELLESNDFLKGVESQRLRTYFTSHCMEPSRDLDEYGRAILYGDFPRVKADFFSRLSRLIEKSGTEAAARAAAAQELFFRRWGPTRVPIYNLILLSTLLNSSARSKHLQVARWLLDEAKVPVDGTDLLGSPALYHAISTKPTFDPEYAQLLYDAGANVNHRNRYGGTAAHEITLIWEPQNHAVVQRAAEALQWYLSHGGNIDIKENDGMTARLAVDGTHKLDINNLPTWEVVDKEDKRRKKLGSACCTFCGRVPQAGSRLLVCSRCKKVTYCPPPQQCQRWDWLRHRNSCNQHKKPDEGVTYLGVKLN
ncbi:hypothetical protein AcV5_008834 [Taiwanofungus camphoratus]|nr:hypothetical protein AcV5_008834 [Antrodia cinnamomea]